MQGGIGLDLAREVLRHLREIPAVADTPVVIISADATERQKENLRAAGAQAYLTKPVNAEFLGTLDSFLP